MLTLSINDSKEVVIDHRPESPMVYLDHWALRRFSEDKVLRDRLVAAIDDTCGTLAVSWINVMEFSRVTDPDQAKVAEFLVEMALPRIFLLDSEFFEVINREDTLLAGAEGGSPHEHREFVKAFFQLKSKSLAPFSANELFTVVQNTSSSDSFDALADDFVGRVVALRDQLDTDAKFQAAIRAAPRGIPIQRGTRYILRELLRTLLIDRNTAMSRNHAVDLFHAVVPLAYCDLVLLDKHWEEQVKRVRARLDRSQLDVPIAEVYSGRRGGVERFLATLEGWDSSGQ
jgi:hypothetical protein